MSSRIEQIIEEIEEYVDSCKYQPLSTTKIVVNKEEIEELLRELRLKTPDEIKRYQKIISRLIRAGHCSCLSSLWRKLLTIMVYNIHACLKSIDESFIFAASILKSLGKYGTDVCHHVICVCDRAETNAVSILCSGIQNLLSLTIRCIDSLVCLRICFLHDLMLGNKLLSFILCICDQCICLGLCILKNGVLITEAVKKKMHDLKK